MGCLDCPQRIWLWICLMRDSPRSLLRGRSTGTGIREEFRYWVEVLVIVWNLLLWFEQVLESARKRLGDGTAMSPFVIYQCLSEGRSPKLLCNSPGSSTPESCRQWPCFFGTVRDVTANKVQGNTCIPSCGTGVSIPEKVTPRYLACEVSWSISLQIECIRASARVVESLQLPGARPT